MGNANLVHSILYHAHKLARPYSQRLAYSEKRLQCRLPGAALYRAQVRAPNVRQSTYHFLRKSFRLPVILYALAPTSDIGNIRETFFANQLKANHTITFSGQGDFRIDDTYTFEVGGKTKSFEQIKDIPNSYLAIDNVEYGTGKRIPLWLFGFLY